MKKLILIILIPLLCTLKVSAQKFESYSVAFTSETSSFPFTRYLPIHPGIELGTTLWNKEKEKLIHEVNIFVGGYYHKKVENGFYIRADYMPTIKLKKIIGIDFPIGLGYQHSFYPGRLYEQNTEGDFDKVNQLGRSHVLTNFGFGFTYLKPKKLQPFIRHESTIDIPLWNGLTGIKTVLKIGVNIKL